MCTIEFDNILIDKIGLNNGIGLCELNFLDKNLQEFIKITKQDGKNYRFLYRIDELDLKNIENIGKNIKEKYDYFVLIGIGGSSLGSEMLFQALKGFYHNLNDKPKFFIMDNIDSQKIDEILNSIDLKKTFFYVVSKSGRTVETIANFLIVLEKVKNLNPNWQEQFLIASDNTENFLGKFAKENGVNFIQLDKNLGGRYSVLSPVGLIPASILSIDIEALIEGAKKTRENFFNNSKILKNPSALIGAIYYLFDVSKNKNILVLMPYSDRLSSFVDWFRQLWAESLGKNGKAQTPIKSIGTLDQHSQLQLYIDGRKDKIITFFNIKNRNEKFKLPNNLPEEIGFLKGKYVDEILKREMYAIREILTEKSIPNITIDMEELTPYSLGQLIMLYEIATAFAGYLYKVNPFDQPAVEEGKKTIYKYLKEDKILNKKGKYRVSL
jgi:glucose-6-phosphate isomerase